MAIPFTCPHCGAEMDVDERFAGQSGPCLVCGRRIEIPWVRAPEQQRPTVEPRVAGRVTTSIAIVAMAVFVLITVIIGAVVLLWPAIDAVRATAANTQCSKNLQQIALALKGYQDDYGCYPPAYVADANGQPMHSWRVLLLPYLGYPALHEKYDFSQPWNSAQNMALLSEMPPVYGCPSNRASDRMYATDYFFVVGPGTLFEKDQSVGADQVRDASRQTLLVVEQDQSAMPGQPTAEISWLEPKDTHIDRLGAAIGLRTKTSSPRHPGGLHVLTVDSQVWQLPWNISEENLEGLATIDGGETLPESLLRP